MRAFPTAKQMGSSFSGHLAESTCRADNREVSCCGPLGPEIHQNPHILQKREKIMQKIAFFFFLPNVELSRMCEDLNSTKDVRSKKLLLFFEEVVDNCSGIY